MPQVQKEHKRSRKPENQQKQGSFSAPNAAESRIHFSKNPKKKRFAFVKLKGLGCKGTSLTASTPAIIRSAAEWETKGPRNRNQKKRKPLQNRRNQENVVFDVPDVCCTPPGIGIVSDVAPRATNPCMYHFLFSIHEKRGEMMMTNIQQLGLRRELLLIVLLKKS